MRARLRAWWQKIKQHPIVAILVFVGSALGIALIVVVVLGYRLNWDWVGLGSYIPPVKNSSFQREKTLWDWLQLLIIPAVLAIGGFIINLTINRTEQEATKQRTNTELETARDNQHETALQTYIDKMSELLLKEDLRESQADAEVRTIARVRTLTTLPRLDGARKMSLLLFLYEARLIEKDKCIVTLDGADLSKAISFRANLNHAGLSGADLSEAYLIQADLSGADLSKASMGEVNLGGADLIKTNLSKAHLAGANLHWANLSWANLSGANMRKVNSSKIILTLRGVSRSMHLNLSHADLSSANLSEADLSHADLNETDLSEAILDQADLSKAIVTDEQLAKAKSLKGVTMPDGSKHP